MEHLKKYIYIYKSCCHAKWSLTAVQTQTTLFISQRIVLFHLAVFRKLSVIRQLECSGNLAENRNTIIECFTLCIFIGVMFALVKNFNQCF